MINALLTVGFRMLILATMLYLVSIGAFEYAVVWILFSIECAIIDLPDRFKLKEEGWF